RWRAGARLFYYSGQPEIIQSGGNGTLARPTIVVPPYAVQRFPDFTRLDLRLEKRWSLAHGWIALVFEGLTGTLPREVITRGSQANLAAPRTPILGDPITIPSVGVEISL